MHNNFVLPFYGTSAKNYNCLVVPNPDSFKSNNKSFSKVPINAHCFGKALVFPIIDTTKYNPNSGGFSYPQASLGPYCESTLGNTLNTYTTAYGKNKKNKKKQKS